MDTKEYMKHYRNYYNSIKKPVTFYLINDDYFKLEEFAVSRGVSVNKFAKESITNFIHSNSSPKFSLAQEGTIKEYMRVSRGIANNINQLALRANIGEHIDINVLLKSLYDYENRFKDLVKKLDL
jgi:hypothetical protein